MDNELFYLIEQEEKRQKSCLELIASENFTSKNVLKCLGSILTNKYSEGLPNKRYYGGNEFIDKIELLCQKRCLEAFELDKEEWGVNVQPYSGSPANLAVFTALLKPHDRIMGLDLPSGGHLTHGYYTSKKKISATSVFFESMPYQIKEDGYVDYEKLQNNVLLFKPKLIICGGSAYPRDWNYSKLRRIADSVNAYLHCDMSHYSGLVSAKLLRNPFLYCDTVMTTTHKTLRGPRAGVIFYKLKFKDDIDFAVFPSLQGGPHNNVIAGIATQMLEVKTEKFQDYCKQVIKNAEVMANEFLKRGYRLMTGGTDTHLVLMDLKPQKITGSKLEYVCDLCNITLNKNAVYGDKSATSPSGVRIGTPALTTRGFKEKDFVKVVDFIDKIVNLTVHIQNLCEDKKLVTFKEKCKDFQIMRGINTIKYEVIDFASQFD